MTEYAAKVPRAELKRIARKGIKQAREMGHEVPRRLAHEIYQAAAEMESFALSSYGLDHNCRCLVGEVRYRRGQDVVPPRQSVEDYLGAVFDDLVAEKAGGSIWDEEVKIV